MLKIFSAALIATSILAAPAMATTVVHTHRAPVAKHVVIKPSVAKAHAQVVVVKKPHHRHVHAKKVIVIKKHRHHR
ncbi:MAG: hypothetical protein BGN84_12830 [Afipia sp. 62-7]|nr:hypothetical protein [Afipia sp.]OJU18729.1 MAG: hypothetical protein BGN84_12830 [Afipia sp. 62-7]